MLQLSKIRDLNRINEETTIGAIEQFTSGIADTGVGIVEFIADKVLTAMNIVRRAVMIDFKPKHDKLVDNIISHYRETNGELTRLQDYTFGDGRKFFENLMETKEIKDKNGDKIKVYTGNLIDENSKEFKQLSQEEQTYLTFFNNEVEKGYNMMYPDAKKKVKRGTIPILKWRSTVGLSGQLLDAVKNDGNKWLNVKNGINSWLDSEFNDLDYHQYKDKKISKLTVDNFAGQMTDGEYRNDLIGFDQDGNLLDKKKNQEFERDLSSVLQLFIANSNRKKQFDKVAPYINSINNFLTLRSTELGLSEDHTAKMLNDAIQRILYNKTSDSESFAKLNKVLSKISSQSSAVMIGLNWPAALGNFVTGFSSNYKEAIMGNITNMFSTNEQEKVFGIKELTEAELKISTDWKLAGEMNKLYGFNSLDYSNMTQFNSRMIQTATGMFSTQKLFWINFIGDYYNRNAFFTAQMLKDGSYDAYSLNAENQIQYDEKKDKRFHTNGVFDSNKPIYKTLKQSLAKEEGVNADGTLKFGYDSKIRNSFKYIADRVHGSYDADFASNLQNYALGKLLLTFRKYFKDKANLYFKVGAGRLNEMEGKYITKEIDGVEVTQWQGTWQEGVWQSFGSIMKALSQGNKDQIKKEQWKNLGLLASDGVMLILLSQLFAAWFDDEDDATLNPLAKNLRNGFITSFASGWDFRIYTRVLKEPFVTFNYLHKQVDYSIDHIVLGNNEDDLDRMGATIHLLKTTTPLAKSFSNTMHVIDYLQSGIHVDKQPE